jgi:hypothetical protein
MMTADPIGGEFYRLASLAQPSISASGSSGASSNLLDQNPIGGELYHLVGRDSRSELLAENLMQARRPSIEGRSASKNSRRLRAAIRNSHTTSRSRQGCVCTAKMTTQRLAAAVPRWQAHYQDGSGTGIITRLLEEGPFSLLNGNR